jgi:hypothetical protein
LLKQNGGGKKTGKKKAKGRAAAAAPASTAPSAGGISLDDIKAVRRLVDKLGSEKVRELVQVLAR